MSEPRSFMNALMWSYAGSLGDKGVSALFFLVIAGILGPKDFGVVSLAIIYVGFLKMFLEQGLRTALIQRKNILQEHLSSVFWMNLGLSFGLVIFAILFSRIWGLLNHSPELALVASVLSLTLVLEALAIVQSAILLREMNFRVFAIRTNVANLISGVIAITLAWKGAGVWALVAQALLRDSIALILLWRLTTWRPTFAFSWPHLKELLGFSTKNFVAQLAIFADSQAASIALGLFIGPLAVGLYRIADRVMATVMTTALASIQAVSLPQFSRHQDYPNELKKSVIACIHVSATATIPALTGLGTVSYALMAAIGSMWLPAAGALKVLCIAGIGAMFTFFTSPLMQALGKPQQVAVLEWTRAFIDCLAFGFAGYLIRDGRPEVQVVSIALARLLVTLLFELPVYVYLLLRFAHISVREFIKPAMPAFAASAGMATVLLILEMSGLLTNLGRVTQLIIEVIVGALVAAGILIFVDSQARNTLGAVVKRLTSRQNET